MNFCNVSSGGICYACYVVSIVFVHRILNNNKWCLISLKLVQQCMKQLGVVYIFVSSLKSEKGSCEMSSWYKMVHYVR